MYSQGRKKKGEEDGSDGYRLISLNQLSDCRFTRNLLILSKLVEHLVIPSVQEVAEMWQGKYGFSPVDERVKQKLVKFNALMFPATIRLQKTFTSHSSSPASAAAVDLDNDRAAASRRRVS